MATWTLITGATGGLGREFARQLADKGNDLVLVGRSEEKLHAMAAELERDHDIEALAFACDLSEPGAAQRLAADVRAAGVEVETLVNNAGFGYDSAFVKSDLARQTALVEVNCLALMQLCYEFAIPMVERGRGAILNVASIAGFMSGPYMSTYYASKAFVQSFSNSLHVELEGYGVKVTTLCPGPIDTPFFENADASSTNLAKPKIDPAYVVVHALADLERGKMMCVPGPVAKAVVFASRLLPRKAIALMAAGLNKK